MKQNFKDISVMFNKPISSMYDNTNAINIFKDLVQYSRTKHIYIRYHFLRENEVKLEYVPTKENIADIFTKVLCEDIFEYLCQKLRVLPLPNFN